ncbi:MAG TPA: NAD/NADP octopine/nopaline dehydrogenase family protein [Actinophytocola sp.]|uniref:NAD/NADP octopine/nopaline dehydrogenase family protein n=1 Tax=Actinophytocola sp. TaxID=1872138 RepID=UPI002DBBD7E8|nr:NAD/NADP octopine/nopaline dehydrogenase family protein [Actinophytocola sp.]HEU5475946.1 NAD/NADP octopine/nopaline dehydrogenase family protein [Actinophytocola sp.]
MTDHRLRVLVCGTGAASHVLAGLISSQPDVELCVYTRSPEKARAWTDTQRHHRLTVAIAGGGDEVTSPPFVVTSDPEQAARGCDMVIVSLPAFAHHSYLSALAPYLERGAVIVGLPGQCGFDFEVRRLLGDRQHEVTLIDFATLPWACRIEKFGRRAYVSGVKQSISGAKRECAGPSRVGDPESILQRLLGKRPALTVAGHLLGITLESMNAIVHPATMYGRWKDWDGSPLDQRPLLYEAIDEYAAFLISEIGREMIAVAEKINATHPEVDFSNVIPIHDWFINAYGPDIRDKRNLMTAIGTNAAYVNIRHPMVEVRPGEFVPNFEHRFLAEDLPFGLVCTRGICEIVGVPTPTIDRIVRWGQEQLGKEYLKQHRLTGRDIGATRCPQRYGFGTLSDLLGPGARQTVASGYAVSRA